jgi:hypothetical protein
MRRFKVTFEVLLPTVNDNVTVPELKEMLQFLTGINESVSLDNPLSELGMDELYPKNLTVEQL